MKLKRFILEAAGLAVFLWILVAGPELAYRILVLGGL